ADLKEHRASAEALAFSGDGRLLVSGSADRTVRLWLRDGESFRPLLTLRSPTGPVKSLALSRDGSRLAVLVRDEIGVRLWNLDRLRSRLAAMNLDEEQWPPTGPASPPDEAEQENRGLALQSARLAAH